MKAKAPAVIAAAIAIVALLAPGATAAQAKPAVRDVHQPARVSVELGGSGTNGFRFALFSFDKAVILFLYRPLNEGSGEEGISYVGGHHALAALDRGRLDLKVGKLGHFRGHLVVTSTKTRKPRKGCTGEPTIVEEGYFVGSFVFHGERGYTTVRAPRESGSITRQGATDCRITSTEPGRHRHDGKRAEEIAAEAAEEDEFRLLAADRKAHLIFQASREAVPPGPGGPATTTFQVISTGGTAGAFQVSRIASIFDIRKDPASSFVIPNLAEPLTEATVEPPAPFSGSATFRLEGPKTASWTGDLAVDSPASARYR